MFWIYYSSPTPKKVCAFFPTSNTNHFPHQRAIEFCFPRVESSLRQTGPVTSWESPLCDVKTLTPPRGPPAPLESSPTLLAPEGLAFWLKALEDVNLGRMFLVQPFLNGK